MMAARRPHSKSRTGCDQCKLRKIKCDEHRPVCHGCQRRSIECRYDDVQRPRKIPAPSSIPIATELELLHHFTLWTCKTCDHGMMPFIWWQEVLPLLAARHECLRYALFAYTSLHMAYLRPADANKYNTLAATYRDQTLKILPTFFNQANLDSEQADACFWSSAFIGLIILGQYHQTRSGERQTPKALLLELATLWRGSVAVGRFHTSTSPGSTVRYRNLPSPDPATAISHTEFGAVLSQVRKYFAHEEHDLHSQNFLDVCTAAVDDLAFAVYLFESEGCSSGILSWVSCLDKQLLDRLNDNVETSLIDFVMIFYGVALHMIRDIWFVQGLGGMLVESLALAVPLKNREKVRLVNWAREEVCE